MSLVDDTSPDQGENSREKSHSSSFQVSCSQASLEKPLSPQPLGCCHLHVTSTGSSPGSGSLQPAVPPGSLGKDAVLAPAALHRLMGGGQNSPAGPSGVQHLHSSSCSRPHWGFQSNRGRARSTLSSEMGKKPKDTGVVGPQCVGVYLSPSGR